MVLCNITTFAPTSATDCPQMCDCFQAPTVLTVLCGGLYDNETTNETMLAQQLELLLSDEGLRENIAQLSITKTPLTQVPMSVCRLSNLTSLFLDNNRLKRLPDDCFANLTSLAWLSVSGNNITELQDGVFDGLNSLRSLNLMHNNIDFIGLHVFSNPNDLVSLRDISLGYNRLQSLEPWPHIRGLHGSIRSNVQVYLESNLISKFTNHIEWKFNCSSPSYASVVITQNYIKHFSDILLGWNITSLYQWLCIIRLVRDPYGYYYPLGFNVNMQGSRNYHCDCADIDFLVNNKYFDINRMFMDVQCSQPRSLAGRFVSQVPLNEFVCEFSRRCPTSCRCGYRPANSTVHLDCSAANLTSLPPDLPPLTRTTDKYLSLIHI